jgi:hypothetical protein
LVNKTTYLKIDFSCFVVQKKKENRERPEFSQKSRQNKLLLLYSSANL